MCLVNQAELHLYLSLYPCEFVEGLLCKPSALLLHLTTESPGLVKAYSPEAAASESFSLHCWLNGRRTKRIIQLNLNRGNKVSVWMRLAAVSQTGISSNSISYSRRANVWYFQGNPMDIENECYCYSSYFSFHLFLTGKECDWRRIKSVKRSETQLFTKRYGLEASRANGSRILESPNDMS